MNWNRAPINSVQDFEFCRNTKLYLQQRAARKGLVWSSKQNPPTIAAMRASGYAKWQKFVTRAQEWHDLCRPMPRRYADFVEVDMAVLNAVLDFDREDSEKAMTFPLRPEHWTARLMPGVYISQKFPDSLTTEDECIQHVLKTEPVAKGMTAWINYAGLKVVWFERGEVSIHPYWPNLTVTKTDLIFASDGRNLGVMRIR